MNNVHLLEIILLKNDILYRWELHTYIRVESDKIQGSLVNIVLTTNHASQACPYR